MNKIALVIGVSGIAGSNLARELVAQGWTTYGLARNPNPGIEQVRPWPLTSSTPPAFRLP